MIDKETKAPVKKGDKLTGNIEITPVWKDCGENKHIDDKKDYICDECGYKLPTPEEPVKEPTAETVPAETAPQKKSGSAGIGMAALAAVGLAAGGGYAVKKKKKES